MVEDMNQEMIFIKLGGSLITDKRKRETPRLQVLRSIAEEIKAFHESHSRVHVLIGHGSGSYGHWEATKHKTHTGVSTKHQWDGFAQVSAAAAKLNRLVADTFLSAGVSILSLQPSASVETESGVIINYSTNTIRKCFDNNIMPLIYGDVAFDRVRGGTIVSTEDLLSYLTPIFQPNRIILLGNAAGVYDNHGNIISKITPANYAEIAPHLHGSQYIDVTGGMVDKVNQMLDLVTTRPNLKVHIISGIKAGNLTYTLMNQSSPPGTVICQS